MLFGACATSVFSGSCQMARTVSNNERGQPLSGANSINPNMCK